MSNPASTGSTFNRIKTWIKEKLTYQDLNNEFNNILSHMDPLGIGSMSSTTSDMRLVTDPFPADVESLATDLNGEIQRLRSMVGKLGGGTYWYSDPVSGFISVTTDLLSYIPFTGETIANTFADTIRHSAIINALSLSSANFATGNLSTNSKFGNYAWTVGTGTVLALLNKAPVKACLSLHFRSFSTGDYLAYNPLMRAYVFLDGSGNVNLKVYTANAASGGSGETTKASATIVGSTNASGNSTYQHLAFNYSFNSFDGAGVDSAALYLDTVSQGTALVSQTIPMNQGAGGTWFFGAKPDALTLGTQAWDHFTSMKNTPDANSDAWAATNAGQGAVSNGILTITTSGATNTLYSLATNIDITALTLETKFKFTSAPSGPGVYDVIYAADNAASRGSLVQADGQNLYLYDKVASGNLQFKMPLDCTQYNVIRLTCLGASPVTKLYVNGVLVWTFTNATSSTPTTAVKFGTATSGDNMTVAVEYFGYIGSVAATVYPPVVVDAGSGQMDDIAIISGNINSTLITNLKGNAAATVYRNDPAPGPYIPPSILTSSGSFTGVNGVVAATNYNEVLGTKLYFASDGKTPLNFAAAFYLSNAGATDSNVASTVDGATGSTFGNLATVTNKTYIHQTSTNILPAGLHRFSLFLGDLSGSNVVSALSGIIRVSRGSL